MNFYFSYFDFNTFSNISHLTYLGEQINKLAQNLFFVYLNQYFRTP